MSRLAEFFGEHDTQAGVFYPTHHLLAMFLTLPEAEAAGRKLQKDGVAMDRVITASADEALEFGVEHTVKDGLWGMFMTKISRMIGTEADAGDLDLLAARKGSAFLVVRCPTGPLKDAAWKSLEPQHPESARFYGLGGIEHLAGDSLSDTREVERDEEKS